MKHKQRLRLVILLLALTLLLTVTMPAPSPAEAQGGWTIECVDCPKTFSDMTDRSLVLDGAGHPHIAYGGDHLYYAYYDGAAWHYETADASPGVGRYAAIALDGSGDPHISYFDDSNKDLRASLKNGELALRRLWMTLATARFLCQGRHLRPASACETFARVPAPEFSD